MHTFIPLHFGNFTVSRWISKTADSQFLSRHLKRGLFAYDNSHPTAAGTACVCIYICTYTHLHTSKFNKLCWHLSCNLQWWQDLTAILWWGPCESREGLGQLSGSNRAHLWRTFKDGKVQPQDQHHCPGIKDWSLSGMALRLWLHHTLPALRAACLSRPWGTEINSPTFWASNLHVTILRTMEPAYDPGLYQISQPPPFFLKPSLLLSTLSLSLSFFLSLPLSFNLSQSLSKHKGPVDTWPLNELLICQSCFSVCLGDCCSIHSSLRTRDIHISELQVQQTSQPISRELQTRYSEPTESSTHSSLAKCHQDVPVHTTIRTSTLQPEPQEAW